uniref:Uncharacterized protein n=1 Tax=Panagrolaimus superbus TaxID=310955 RepID=A0A914YJQ7_9BILA
MNSFLTGIILVRFVVEIYSAPAYPYQQSYQPYPQQQQRYPSQQQFYQPSNNQYRPNQPYQNQNNNQQFLSSASTAFPFTDTDLINDPIYSNLTDDKKAEIENILKDDAQSVPQMQQRLQALGATWPDYDKEAIKEAMNEVGVTLAPRPVDLSEEAYKFYDKKQSILQNSNLTVAEMKRQLKELMEQTNPRIQQEVEQKLQASITTTPPILF